MNDMSSSPPVPAGFAARLKALRRQRGWSQKELGEKVDLHHTHISRYENGTSRPTGDALQRLAEVLDVPAEYLMGGEAAEDRLQHAELLKRFQKAVRLPAEDQAMILHLLDALIVRREMEGLLRSYTQKPTG
jgi:transcriptional regulator with XRE-family HTH domain